MKEVMLSFRKVFVATIFLGSLFINSMASSVKEEAIKKEGIFDLKQYKIGYKFTDEKKAKAFLKRWNSRPIEPFYAPTMRDLEAVKDPNKKKRLKEAIKILTKTASEVGPYAPNPKTRYSHNSLACSNCHSAGAQSGLPGTKPYVMPYVNVINDYPKLDTKSMKIISLL